MREGWGRRVEGAGDRGRRWRVVGARWLALETKQQQQALAWPARSHLSRTVCVQYSCECVSRPRASAMAGSLVRARCGGGVGGVSARGSRDQMSLAGYGERSKSRERLRSGWMGNNGRAGKEPSRRGRKGPPGMPVHLSQRVELSVSDSIGGCAPLDQYRWRGHTPHREQSARTNTT